MDSIEAIKESNPVKVAEFAKACEIVEEPAFKWWVSYTLHKREAIIASIKFCIQKTTHKYGIAMPRTLEEAYQLNKKMGIPTGGTQQKNK